MVVFGSVGGRWVQKIVYVGEVLDGFGDFWVVLGQLGVVGCRRLYTLVRFWMVLVTFRVFWGSWG